MFVFLYVHSNNHSIGGVIILNKTGYNRVNQIIIVVIHASYHSTCSSFVVFLRRNQICSAKKTTTPTASMADITEKPMVYLGLSLSGNRYYSCQTF